MPDQPPGAPSSPESAPSAPTLLQSDHGTFSIARELNPPVSDLRHLRDQLLAHASGQSRPYDQQHVAVLARDERQRLVGGLFAEIYWGWLHVDALWVEERLRHLGIGRALLREAEDQARRHDCRHAFLDTFSFQALGFYRKAGYEVFGSLDDFPEGHQRHFMRKRLVPEENEQAENASD
ncbi:Acetyltransferase (GNAT) family protein [Planctomycetes bacterium Pan216]|uniref:Acetyltransferase (GNAT) family protein n=1 Tax=Kolteria novifilia TaxID=2527975 RepID=A0A518B5E9_9BACT|nr:Acetyltransferase (GNAT) family protein [Planctomycetes bacterium Pan216]